MPFKWLSFFYTQQITNRILLLPRPQKLCLVGGGCAAADNCVCPATTPACDAGKCKPYCATNAACAADCYCPTSTNMCVKGICKVRLW